MKKIPLFFLLLFSFFTLPSISAPLTHTQEAYAINTAIKNVLSASNHPYIDKKSFSNYKQVLDDLYFLSPDHLLWVNQLSRNSEKIDTVFNLISTANARGLNQEHYNLTNLQTLWKKTTHEKKVTYTKLAYLDTAITLNLIHFISDLHFGRINPKSLTFSFDTLKKPLAITPLILKAIQTNEVSHLADLVEPSVPAYQLLKKALLEYRKKETGKGLNTLKYISSIRPKDSSQQLIKIRQQLNLLGIPTNNSDTPFFYDQALSDQIKKLQFHHGLKEDGVIGKQTIKALNVPLSQSIQKIELALERFRWLPKIQNGPLIMVNIPAFQLRAYHTDKISEKKSLTMKVIVGKSKENKSPVFTANMQFLEFSPYWNIPKSITINEILPKLINDPLYLKQHNMEVVTGFHKNETALPYLENSFEHLKSGTLKLRQRPGKGNALGKVKFIFPNNYNVYLHDTPSKHLFRKSKRDLSHGCIRVEKPAALASFLLEPRTNWSHSKIFRAMRSPSPKKVQLKTAVPVIIYYSTAAIVKNEVIFYDDIYNYDSRLNQVLVNHIVAPSTPLVNVAHKN